MKYTFTFLALLLITGALTAQCLYSKTKVELKGSMAIFSRLVNATSVSYQKNNKVRSITKSMGVTQEIISLSDKVIILNKFSPKCAVITKAELAEDSLENEMPTTDVQIEKTSESQKLLEYDCVKTIIRYKIKGMNYETAVWSTKEITVPTPAVKPLESMKRSSYLAALESIEGFVLKTETYMKSSAAKTIVTVIEISTKEFDDSVFEVDDKLCKEPLNLKEYKNELQRQKASRATGTGF